MSEYDEALFSACMQPETASIVSFLLERGASVDARDMIDQTPLIIAAQHGCRETVEILLAAGSDIYHKNQQGDNPLITATQEGYIDIVKVLLDAGADINEPNSDGETPLILAIKLRHKQELIDLLEKKKKIIDRYI